MKTSDSIKEIALALCNFNKTVGAITKSSENPFFKSSYADLSSIIMHITPHLNNNGLVIIQTGSEVDENSVAWQKCTKVTTRLIHTSGEWIEDSVLVPMGKVDAQGMGSAFTYGRRYGIQALLNLPAVDDDGEASMPRNVTVPIKDISTWCSDTSIDPAIMGKWLQNAHAFVPEAFNESPLPSGDIKDADIDPALCEWVDENSKDIQESIKNWLSGKQ